MSEIQNYRLLDSGSERKLEQVGPYLIERQCPVAFWKAKLPASSWSKAVAVHVRSEKGGGHWNFKAKNLPPFWWVLWGGLKLKVKLTSFGHLGFFAEQASQWQWFQNKVVELQKAGLERPKILNLFAYTGGSSLSLAKAGAVVSHVDAAKGIVDWGRENAAENDIADISENRGGVRWIVDDVLKFLHKEARRGNLYDGFVMDPPSYGRGPDGEVFKIEEQILPLFDALTKVVKKDISLAHFSCHTPGFSPEVLKNLCREHFPSIVEGQSESGEMKVPSESGFDVPSGFYFRF